MKQSEIDELRHVNFEFYSKDMKAWVFVHKVNKALEHLEKAQAALKQMDNIDHRVDYVLKQGLRMRIKRMAITARQTLKELEVE